jgi:hypothetical protein
MTDNVVVHFTVLFTTQKTKKFKTWQDGTMKYYENNKKVIHKNIKNKIQLITSM